MKSVIKKVKEERKALKMTVKDLCFAAKITETTYYNFCTGKDIGYKTLFKFFEILKIDVIF